MTLASVIVPSRGGAKRLPILFEALAQQDDKDWEAIVVLDGDVDDSASVISAYSHLPIRAVVFPENRGRVAALNAGFAEASGEILIRCDDDLTPRSTYIRHHKQAHEHQSLGVVGLCQNQLDDTPYARAYGFNSDKRFREQAYKSPRPWQYWAANCSITREIWEKIGPYDPAYRAYGWEDVDYGYRLHAAGIPVVLTPELETPHRAAAVTTASRTIRAFHSGAARKIFESKHGTQVLPPAIPSEKTLWTTLVKQLSHAPGPGIFTCSARAVDAAARVLPVSVSRKLIALVVESSAISGYRQPDKATSSF